jgi:hypothetical protein
VSALSVAPNQCDAVSLLDGIRRTPLQRPHVPTSFPKLPRYFAAYPTGRAQYQNRILACHVALQLVADLLSMGKFWTSGSTNGIA